MTVPNFIVFGTRKAGTTSLYHYLSQHPNIFMSNLKGTRFFMFDPDSPELGTNLPVKSLEEFERHFVGSDDPKFTAIGEVSPSYLHSSNTAKRMSETLPQAKLIASLRNPVDKLYSQYQMDMRSLPSNKRVTLTSKNADRWFEAGLYCKHLKEYYAVYRKEDIAIYIFEEWIRDPLAMVKKMYSFLQVDCEFQPNLDMIYNSGGMPKNEVFGSLLKHRPFYVKLKPYVPAIVRSNLNRLRNSNMEKAPPLNSDLRQYLLSLYSDDIAELESILGRELSVWKES